MVSAVAVEQPVLGRRGAEAAPEHAAEVRRVREPPALADRFHRAGCEHRVEQVAAAALELAAVTEPIPPFDYRVLDARAPLT